MCGLILNAEQTEGFPFAHVLALQKGTAFLQLKCPQCLDPARNLSPVQVPSTPIGAHLTLLGCKGRGEPLHEAGQVLLCPKSFSMCLLSAWLAIFQQNFFEPPLAVGQ